MASTPDTHTLELSLRLMRARRHAESGRWREAETELSPGGGLPGDTLALRALAVVVTQSGDYARALYIWRQLLAREPGNGEAHRMTEAIALWQSRPDWYRFLPAGAGVAALLLLVPVLLWAFSPSKPKSPFVAAPQPVHAPAASSQSFSPSASRPAAPVPSSKARPAQQAAPRPVAPVASPAAPQDDAGPLITLPKAKPSRR